MIDSTITNQLPGEISEWVHEKFGTVHVFVIGGDIWFLGREIAEILGFKKSRNAIKTHVKPIDKKLVPSAILNQMASAPKSPVLGRLKFHSPRGYTLINECGFYSLIMRSKLESALVFQDWVTREVLPSIRKHGAYFTPEKLSIVDSNPGEKDLLIEGLKADANYTRRVLKSDEALPITLIAKEYGMTAKNFNDLLIALKIQYRSNSKRHTRYYPCHAYAPLGWFTNKTHLHDDKNNEVHTSTYLCMTQLGRNKLREYLATLGIKPIIA